MKLVLAMELCHINILYVVWLLTGIMFECITIKKEVRFYFDFITELMKDVMKTCYFISPIMFHRGVKLNLSWV